MNGLVSGLTLGIFTPRSVVVTCAARSSANNVLRLDVASSELGALRSALKRAEAISREAHQGVYVSFPPPSGSETESVNGGLR
jgi:hypothetical protein